MDELAALLRDMSKDMLNSDKAILLLVEKLITEQEEMKSVIISLSKSVAVHSTILKIMIEAAGSVANESDKDVH